MTPETIHTRVVPTLQAALWTIALFIGTVSFQSIGNPVLVKLISVFIIFLVFIWESAIMFLDIKNVNPGKNGSSRNFSEICLINDSVIFTESLIKLLAEKIGFTIKKLILLSPKCRY